MLLYTDGACKGNPGPGGWAAILIHPATGKEREISGAEPATTNNRMELTAVIEGLRLLRKPADVDVYSDSRYVVQGMTSWIHDWVRRGWKTAAKKHDTRAPSGSAPRLGGQTRDALDPRKLRIDFAASESSARK